jgi:hypothetical protein
MLPNFSEMIYIGLSFTKNNYSSNELVRDVLVLKNANDSMQKVTTTMNNC